MTRSRVDTDEVQQALLLAGEAGLRRSCSAVLQELRVVQTGVQLLTGLLLTVPFQARFADLSDFQRNVYLGTVSMSVAPTAVLIAPIALHRVLFRQHVRPLLIGFSQRSALAGLALLAMASAMAISWAWLRTAMRSLVRVCSACGSRRAPRPARRALRRCSAA